MAGVNPYLNTPPTKLKRDIAGEKDAGKKKQMKDALGAWRAVVPGPFRKGNDMKTAAEELLKVARVLMARGPKIGPGVILEGKKGVFSLSRPVMELKVGPGGYSRMMDSGYTHFVELVSPRGKRMEFYIKDGARDGRLYWYKNHRTQVPFKYESVDPENMGPSPMEKKAIAFGKNKSSVINRAFGYLRMLDRDYIEAFADGDWKYDSRKQRVVSSDGKYGLQWLVRRYPDEPVGPMNTQSKDGEIVLLTPRDRWSSYVAARDDIDWVYVSILMRDMVTSAERAEKGTVDSARALKAIKVIMKHVRKEIGK